MMQTNQRKMQNQKSSRSTRKAFTLIELLVVIAIISLLVSIMLPSLNKARDLAKSVVCQTNLRGLGVAVAFYRQESDDKMYNAAYGGFHWTRVMYNQGVLESSQQTRCPNQENVVFEDNPTDYDSWSTPAWNYDGNLVKQWDKSLGGLPAGYAVSGVAFYQADTVDNRYWNLGSFQNLVKPDQTPLFFDSNRNAVWRNYFPFISPDYLQYFSFRTLERCNFVYLDGHCEPHSEDDVLDMNPNPGVGLYGPN